MSITDETPEAALPPAVFDLASVADRVAAKTKRRQERRGTILTVPFPGLEDEIAGAFRRLGFEEKADIVSRSNIIDENGAPNIDETLPGAADMLINGCQDILAVTGRDEKGNRTYQSLGVRLTTDTISQLFKQEFSPGTTVRSALLLAMDHDDVISMFSRYMDAVDELDEDDMKDRAPGESVPSLEGLSS